MSGVFEVLASYDEDGARGRKRAAIAAQERAQFRFAKFVANSNTEQELTARLILIDDQLTDIAKEAAEEYSGDAEIAYLAATAVLGAGHASDCTCGFCENKGQFGKKDDEPDDDEDDKKEASMIKEAPGKEHMKGVSPKRNRQYEHIKEQLEASGKSEDKAKEEAARTVNKQRAEKGETKDSSWAIVSADTETGDSYQSERVDLPSADASGLGSEGSPKIDKGKSGDEAGWSLPDIDVGSKAHQQTEQDTQAAAEYNDADFDPSSPIRDRIDADKPIGGRSELETADNTKTWTGTEGQADPVTSESLNQVAARYQIVETQE